jgi:hypothetical protein
MSTRPLIAKYPLDKTGTSPTNKVIGEVRELNGSRDRAFVPFGGPFYTESFKIINNDTGLPLVPVDDYILCQPFQQAALRTGKDVQCVVWIKLPAPITVRYEYQVVGGEYSWNIEALVQMINEIDLDGRPVQWGSIIGKPTAYPPAPHIHDIGDSYGWEYVVFQLEGIRNAILVGDEASHDELRQQMQAIRDELELLIAAVDDKVDLHIADYANPHRVTKLQVGLGQVQDFPIASASEALAGTATNRYMTPALTTTLINRLIDEQLGAHIADKNNPHNTTKAQVGLGSVLNYGVATTGEAQAGAVNDKYMTPALTKAAIMFVVGDAFNTHVANTNNPHGTTATQVGLGLVQNYGVATTAEALAGTATNKYMTPQLTNAAIKATASDALIAHIADKGNPHGTTAAQVGLGNLPNAITRSRFSNSDAQLLTAGSMFDHVNSGDHDARYNPKNNVSVDGSIHISGGRGYVAISGGWRQFWPAQWVG